MDLNNIFHFKNIFNIFLYLKYNKNSKIENLEIKFYFLSNKCKKNGTYINLFFF